jgi:hypothetical protein
VRNGNIDAHRDSVSVGSGDQVNNNVQRATLRVIWEAVFGFALDIVGSTSEASQRSKEQEDSIHRIANMVVKRWKSRRRKGGHHIYRSAGSRRGKVVGYLY